MNLKEHLLTDSQREVVADLIRQKNDAERMLRMFLGCVVKDARLTGEWSLDGCERLVQSETTGPVT